MGGLVLALGGGGARGFAHLGVLQALSREKIPIAGLVGTSMGAAVAAVFGAGADLGMLERFAAVFPWGNILDVRLPRLGLAGGERIQTILRLLTKGKSLDELDPPVWVVAADLDLGVPVVFREGPLAPAVMASAAVPGIFAPIRIQGRRLVDGGVVAGVPVEIAREMGRPVVAVDVGFDFQAAAARSILGVLGRVVKIMGMELDRRQVIQADLAIRPPVGIFGSSRFDLAREIVEAGRSAAERKLPDLWKLICGRAKA